VFGLDHETFGSFVAGAWEKFRHIESARL